MRQVLGHLSCGCSLNQLKLYACSKKCSINKDSQSSVDTFLYLHCSFDQQNIAQCQFDFRDINLCRQEARGTIVVHMKVTARQPTTKGITGIIKGFKGGGHRPFLSPHSSLLIFQQFLFCLVSFSLLAACDDTSRLYYKGSFLCLLTKSPW